MTTQTEIRPAAAGRCTHHWVIETPNGAASAGVCKRCGVSKQFTNSLENAGWDRGLEVDRDLARARSTRERVSRDRAEFSLADES